MWWSRAKIEAEDMERGPSADASLDNHSFTHLQQSVLQLKFVILFFPKYKGRFVVVVVVSSVVVVGRGEVSETGWHTHGRQKVNVSVESVRDPTALSSLSRRRRCRCRRCSRCARRRSSCAGSSLVRCSSPLCGKTSKQSSIQRPKRTTSPGSD